MISDEIQNSSSSLVSPVQPEREDQVADLHHNKSNSNDSHDLEVICDEVL